MVRIFLPRSNDAVVKKERSSATQSNAGANETILVIDDDPNVLETTRSMFDDLGYRFVVAENPAVAVVAQQPVDLAIIDLAMPGSSGLEVGLQLQQRQPTCPFGIVAVIRTSSHDQQANEQ